MGKKQHRTYEPEQDFLLPPSLREWLPEGHLAYFVSDVIDQVELSSMDAVYGEELRGQPPFHPGMMTKVLVYGYCVGVFSSRKLATRLEEDVAFRVLPAGNEPDFRTISDFRKIHLQTLEGLFEQVLKIALEAGAMKVGHRQELLRPSIGTTNSSMPETVEDLLCRITSKPLPRDPQARKQALVYGMCGKPARTLEMLRSAELAVKAGRLDPMYPAFMYAVFGQREQAFQWLDYAIQRHSNGAVFVRVAPELDNIRADPRFAAVLRRVGAN